MVFSAAGASTIDMRRSMSQFSISCVRALSSVEVPGTVFAELEMESLELSELLKATILRHQVDWRNFYSDCWVSVSCSNAFLSTATVEVQLLGKFLISLL